MEYRKPSSLDMLQSELPPVLWRNNPRFRELTGISPRTMANLDALKQGPKRRVKNGQLVGYPRDAMVLWLSRRWSEEAA